MGPGAVGLLAVEVEVSLGRNEGHDFCIATFAGNPNLANVHFVLIITLDTLHQVLAAFQWEVNALQPTLVARLLLHTIKAPFMAKRKGITVIASRGLLFFVKSDVLGLGSAHRQLFHMPCPVKKNVCPHQNGFQDYPCAGGLPPLLFLSWLHAL